MLRNGGTGLAVVFDDEHRRCARKAGYADDSKESPQRSNLGSTGDHQLFVYCVIRGKESKDSIQVSLVTLRGHHL